MQIIDQIGAVDRNYHFLAQVGAFAASGRVIDRDTVKPCGKICLSTKLPDGAVGGQEDFLGSLSGIIIIAEHTVNEIEDRLFMPAYEDFEGVNVTAL
jgi:hypothetical protein